MAHKRIHVRVPITGEATVSDEHGTQAKMPTIDISPGGVGVISPSSPLGQTDYKVEIVTENDRKIRFTATLIRGDEQSTGFQTAEIDKKNLQVIADLVTEFQSTEEFIKQIDEHNLLEQNFIDEDGNEVSVTFDVGTDT